MIELRAPQFWNKPRMGIAAVALWPLSLIWRAAGALRARIVTPYTSSIPVICVGNVTLGGAGKTPVTIALAQQLGHRRLCFLTRGYGGIINVPVLVRDENTTRYGDEAVLLARHAPVIVAPDRAQGLRLAEQSGFDLVIADDGFQNPSFTKTSVVLVFDGAVGIGNGACVPAGPCRETLDASIARASAAVIIGTDATGLTPRLAPLPLFNAHVTPLATTPGPVVAFAGIGRPEKFFESLKNAGYHVISGVPFPDHHAYTPNDMTRLHSLATHHNARLITTEKDHVRLPTAMRTQVDVLPIRLDIDDIDGLLATLGVA